MEQAIQTERRSPTSALERFGLRALVGYLYLQVKSRPHLLDKSGSIRISDSCTVDAYDTGFNADFAINEGKIDYTGSTRTGRIEYCRTGPRTSRYVIRVGASDSDGHSTESVFRHPPAPGEQDDAAIEHFSTVFGVIKALRRSQ